MTTNALITGWGMYAPSRVMTNDELSKIVDTSDEWIVSRTGIRERRIAADDETATTLSVHAARDALAVAGVDGAELDLVIVATCTPDYPLPATAVLVATELGAKHASGFDLQAACSGFLYALATGNSFIKSGMYRNVLVIGVEVLSRFLDWTDRSTCVLFGDGAGAVLLQASDQPGGMLGFDLFSDGTGCEGIIMPAGGSARPASHATVVRTSMRSACRAPRSTSTRPARWASRRLRRSGTRASRSMTSISSCSTRPTSGSSRACRSSSGSPPRRRT